MTQIWHFKSIFLGLLFYRNIGKHDVDLAHADLICQIFKIRIDGQI